MPVKVPSAEYFRVSTDRQLLHLQHCGGRQWQAESCASILSYSGTKSNQSLHWVLYYRLFCGDAQCAEVIHTAWSLHIADTLTQQEEVGISQKCAHWCWLSIYTIHKRIASKMKDLVVQQLSRDDMSHRMSWRWDWNRLQIRCSESYIQGLEVLHSSIASPTLHKSLPAISTDS
jgi:hypothetical protein